MKNFIIILCSLFIIACSTTNNTSQFDKETLFKLKEFDYLVFHLEKEIKENPNDLNLKLNLATIYQIQKKYNLSNKIFIEVRERFGLLKKRDSKDKIISQLLSDNYTKYNIPEYEQFLIQIQIIFNFIALNDFEGALIESKNMDYVIFQLKKDKEYSFLNEPAFSYISGMVYELNNKYDEAYIDYKRVYDMNQNYPYIKFDLIRTGYLSKRSVVFKNNDYLTFVKKKQKYDNILIISQEGLAPLRSQDEEWKSVYKLTSRVNYILDSKVKVNSEFFGIMHNLIDIDNLANNFLKARKSILIKQSAVKTIGKEALGWAIGAPGGFAGVFVARTIAHETSNIDERSWFYLASKINFVRLNVNKNDIVAIESDGIELTYKNKKNIFVNTHHLEK